MILNKKISNNISQPFICLVINLINVMSKNARLQNDNKLTNSISKMFIITILTFLLVANGLYASPAIAVWAFPDGVSVPYRDTNNNILPRLINIGLCAYHATGILRVDFFLNGQKVTTVTNESLNPVTDEYEFVYTLNPADLIYDGKYTITSIVYPNNNEQTELPELIIQKDTMEHNILYVEKGYTGSEPNIFPSINDACNSAQSGDIIKVRSGVYAGPDNSGYGFSDYVTIMPAAGASVIINSNTYLRSPYLKFIGITFDKSNIGSSAGHHYWFNNCTFIGIGKDNPKNLTDALAFKYDSNHIVVENSTIHDASVGVTATTSGIILRNNHVYDQTSDGFDYDGNDILITGNIIHNTKQPIGGTQHCDFIASNSGANQVIIRNNLCYDGMHQGIKLGGFNDGRDQPYFNIAIINNEIALNKDLGSVNFRFQGQTNGQRFDNILVEFNTFWNGSSIFIIASDINAQDAVIRNNIFGPKSVQDMSNYGQFIIDNNIYNQNPATGINSLVDDPGFNSVENWNFSLMDNSPCINKADISSNIYYDINWSIRNSMSDIGAYEFNTGPNNRPARPSAPLGLRIK